MLYYEVVWPNGSCDSVSLGSNEYRYPPWIVDLIFARKGVLLLGTIMRHS
jgi:hypothetical protein